MQNGSQTFRDLPAITSPIGLQTGLTVEYSSLAECGSESWSDVLGIGAFQITAAALHLVQLPIAAVGTPVLGESGGFCEVWRTRRPVEAGQWGSVRYRHDANVLFGCITVSEAELPPAWDNCGSPLHEATKLAYREIHGMLHAVGYGHLLRVWNYVPQINVDANGTERYWQFNSGRREALMAVGRDVTGSVPAACALGSVAGSPLTIYFLASRAQPLLFENPRQVSAFDYPPQYGPSPVFSRASMLREAGGATLFVAGTASIVGHQTVHPGDAAAQTQETLTNIEELLVEVNRSAAARFSLDELAYKVYVRNPGDLPIIQGRLRALLGSGASVRYLKADICRKDLLVEIEATAFQCIDTGE